MPTFILYGTSDCHLCEDAASIVQAVLLAQSKDTLTIVDIVNDEILYLRYGMIIPVLEHAATQRSLCWPFDTDAVHNFVSNEK